MDHIAVRCVSKSYGDPRRPTEAVGVFSDFSLSVREGELLTLFGPNGCGKTTLLNMVAGILSPDHGSVAIAGQAPCDARIGYVFQNFQLSLFPWRRSIDNIGFPLELRGLRRRQCRDRARRLLSDLDISLPEQAFPYSLSGGQQQLLAISRALIAEPAVLLLDEPFNQLDYQTRLDMQDKLLDIWERTQTTIIFVSHDIEEALLLGDRTVFLSRRPARVLEIVENRLPRPRRHEVLESEEFFELKRRGLRLFQEALTS